MKIIKICCAVIAACFVVIAYSQYQSQKAHWQLVEAQQQMTVVQILNSPSGRELGLFYQEKIFALGWSLKDALDSLYYDPVQPKKNTKETSKQKSKEEEAQEAIKWAEQLMQEDKQQK